MQRTTGPAQLKCAPTSQLSQPSKFDEPRVLAFNFTSTCESLACVWWGLYADRILRVDSACE